MWCYGAVRTGIFRRCFHTSRRLSSHRLTGQHLRFETQPIKHTGSEGNSTSCASLNCFSVVCNQISENLVFRCLTSFWKIAQFLSAFECLKGFYKKSWSSSDVQLSEERFTWFGFMFNKETNSPLTRSMHLQLLLFIKTKKIKKHFQYLKLVI